MSGLPCRLVAGLALAGIVLGPVSAAAQDSRAESDDIVVTGQAATTPTRAEVSRQARSITPPGDIRATPLARFEDRLCPGISGLKADYAGLMVARIRDHAEGLGMWMAEDGNCSPNFVIAFVDDGQAAIAELERSQGHLFDTLTLPERRELLAETGPARVWTSTATRTRDGMPIARRESLTDPPVTQMAMAHSKIYLSTREDITSVLVVFDRRQVAGRTLDQLADYATMRGLARTRPIAGEGTAMDTILSLFDESAPPPAGLTDFDRAYLASLYDWIPNLPAAARVLGVNRQLRLAAQREGGD